MTPISLLPSFAFSDMAIIFFWGSFHIVVTSFQSLTFALFNILKAYLFKPETFIYNLKEEIVQNGLILWLFFSRVYIQVIFIKVIGRQDLSYSNFNVNMMEVYSSFLGKSSTLHLFCSQWPLSRTSKFAGEKMHHVGISSPVSYSGDQVEAFWWLPGGGMHRWLCVCLANGHW